MVYNHLSLSVPRTLLGLSLVLYYSSISPEGLL